MHASFKRMPTNFRVVGGTILIDSAMLTQHGNRHITSPLDPHPTPTQSLKYTASLKFFFFFTFNRISTMDRHVWTVSISSTMFVHHCGWHSSFPLGLTSTVHLKRIFFNNWMFTENRNVCTALINGTKFVQHRVNSMLSLLSQAGHSISKGSFCARTTVRGG